MKSKVGEGFVQATSANSPQVDLAMLTDFIYGSKLHQSSEIKHIKTERSMRPNYGDVATGYVQLKRHQNLCTVQAQICPEHRTNAKNYNNQVVVNEKVGSIEEGQCYDCAASQGGCKHAVAVVAWVYRKSEEPAPTSVACYWRKPSLSNVGSTIKYITTQKMLAGERSGDSKEPSDAEELANKNFLRRIQHDDRAKHTQSHLFRFFNQSLTQKMSLHFQSVVFNGDRNSPDEFLRSCRGLLSPQNCAYASEITVNQSNCIPWFLLGLGRITASIINDAASCKTLNGSLVGKILSMMNFDSPAMRRGRKLESEILRETGNFLVEEFKESPAKKCGLLLKVEYPALGASPDGITEEAVIEIKCPTSDKTMKNYYDGKQIKKKYKAQLHVQMLFANKSRGYFCIADPKFETTKKVTIVREDFDKKFTKKIIAKAIVFWKNAIFPQLMKE